MPQQKIFWPEKNKHQFCNVCKNKIIFNSTGSIYRVICNCHISVGWTKRKAIEDWRHYHYSTRYKKIHECRSTIILSGFVIARMLEEDKEEIYKIRNLSHKQAIDGVAPQKNVKGARYKSSYNYRSQLAKRYRDLLVYKYEMCMWTLSIIVSGAVVWSLICPLVGKIALILGTILIAISRIVLGVDKSKRSREIDLANQNPLTNNNPNWYPIKKVLYSREIVYDKYSDWILVLFLILFLNTSIYSLL